MHVLQKGRVAVTGASGMVGRHLLRLLAARGVPIATASRTPPRTLPAGTTWVRWDLCQWKTPVEIDDCLPEASALVHLGAVIPTSFPSPASAEVFDANVRATLCLGLWALERELPLVYLSSATVYADPCRDGILESDATTLTGAGGFYGLTKLLAENVLRHLAAQGLRIAILRPSSLYGAGLPAGKMITNFLRQADAGMTIELAPPTDDRINVIHAQDVSGAIIAALEREASGTFNIAGARPSTILEIAHACVDAVGTGGVQVGPGTSSRPPETRFGLECDAARAAFGFSPQLTLADGIRKMWSDMSEQ